MLSSTFLISFVAFAAVCAHCAHCSFRSSLLEEYCDIENAVFDHMQAFEKGVTSDFDSCLRVMRDEYNRYRGLVYTYKATFGDAPTAIKMVGELQAMRNVLDNIDKSESNEILIYFRKELESLESNPMNFPKVITPLRDAIECISFDVGNPETIKNNVTADRRKVVRSSKQEVALAQPAPRVWRAGSRFSKLIGLKPLGNESEGRSINARSRGSRTMALPENLRSRRPFNCAIKDMLR